jgi:hypothetical protein
MCAVLLPPGVNPIEVKKMYQNKKIYQNDKPASCNLREWEETYKTMIRVVHL